MATTSVNSSTATSRPQASAADHSPPPQAAAPAPEAAPAAEPKTDTYGATTEAPDLSGSAAKDAMTPAVMRAALIAGARMKLHQAAVVGAKATAFIMRNPEMVTAFRQALPAIAAASTNNPTALRVAGAMANPSMTRALLTTAREIGGTGGTRMMAAVLRGMGRGGVPHAAAELGATAAKVGAAAHAGSALGRGLTKAMPVIGNAANLFSVGLALHKMLRAMEDPNMSKEDFLAHSLHVAASVAGCFVPPIGVAGDLAFAAWRANEKKEGENQEPSTVISDLAAAGLRASTKGFAPGAL